MFARNYTTTTTNYNTNKSISTDIIYAIATDDMNSVKRLIRSTNVNDIIDEKNGFTALHIAITKSSDNDIVKYLLSIGADSTILTRKNQDSCDLAFDHRKRYIFTHTIEQKQQKIDELLIKNDTLNAKIIDLNDRNQYLTKANEGYSERIKLLQKNEVEPIKSQLKNSSTEVSRITKLYDETSDECKSLKRKIDDLTQENTKLKTNLKESEQALEIVLKKHKKT